MLINFDQIEETIIPHFRGGEKETRSRMFVEPACKIMRGKLEPGASIGLHTHDTSSEIIYILEGRGKALFDGNYEEVEAGLCHYCPKGYEHSLINDSDRDLIFFAVVPEQ
ncbi:Uncharacterized conserved protein%2C contains double-stranded beta-helix domain [uncultured Eubacterium sp.]|nr:Uncharacterized conserved protein%2C contains double-stranded beta-helix domain [uncultured Eubacterium sp.]